jgi:hypothetical protein
MYFFLLLFAFAKRAKTVILFWALWLTSVVSVLGRLRQEDGKFKASLGYIVSPCLKTNKK